MRCSPECCAILAAAVIGSFSWDNITEPYWLASALWYSSLVLSILGVMISAQQVSILELLGVRRNHRGDPLLTVSDVRRYLPLMLTEVHPHQSALGSAVQMTDGARPAIAIVYLAVFGVAGAVFEFCSFWGYHYVDLGHWSDETLEADAASPL
ncbi:MAG: hypothetical protein LQ342_007596 [Letrouitia transgressa]|nr:MAG: hypothetical protein LQ342_007596 [Letrouitia transgressa]